MNFVSSLTISWSLGRVCTTLFLVMCLGNLCQTANAGVLLHEYSSAEADSMDEGLAVPATSSPTLPDNGTPVEPVHVKEAPSGMSPSVPPSSVSVHLTFGDIVHQIGSAGGLLVVTYRHEVLPTLTDPFLEGILRPPQVLQVSV